jgi:hypothetical protein
MNGLTQLGSWFSNRFQPVSTSESLEDGREKKGRGEAERLGQGGMVRLATGFSQWFLYLVGVIQRRNVDRGTVGEERDMFHKGFS